MEELHGGARMRLRASTARTLSGDGVMKVQRLGSCESFAASTPLKAICIS